MRWYLHITDLKRDDFVIQSIKIIFWTFKVIIDNDSWKQTWTYSNILKVQHKDSGLSQLRESTALTDLEPKDVTAWFIACYNPSKLLGLS